MLIAGMNEGESAAMWELYSRMDDGVAIRSSIRKLKDIARERAVSIGRVRYSDVGVNQPARLPILTKRKRVGWECHPALFLLIFARI